MKKLILTTALLVGCAVGAYSQGTVVFQNAVGSINGKVDLGTLGTPENGTFTVQLFYGTVGTSLANLTPGVIFTSTLGSGLFYDTATQTLTGVPLGAGSSDPTASVELAIVGWSGNAPSLAAAQAGGAAFGETAEFTNPTGGGGSPAATAANLVGWTAANSLVLAVPEPSTIVLGGLGAAALLAFRRRNK